MVEKLDNLVDGLSFEKALEELEKIVQALESGEVELEKSVALYERGEKLKARCETLLRQAEERVEKVKANAEGEAQGVEPFEAE
ncbi:MAG: exodeoxyribonuclease VII small subunit [Alphaproteobacteria bacterium]|nr:exodeoxyribonuclease VII small subunit [Alphaproteobacteria bacterium]